MLRRTLNDTKPLSEIYSSMEHKDTVFLDSSMRNNVGRYSVIGLLPHSTISFRSTTIINDKIEPQNIIDQIDQMLSECSSECPMCDPIMGYISYDHGLRMMGIRSKHEENEILEYILMRFDVIMLEDHKEGRTDIFCHGNIMDEELEMEMALEMISRIQEYPVIPECRGYEILDDIEKEEYIIAIETAKKRMVEGEMYVMNMTHTMEVRSGSDPFGTFMRLREISPSPFGAYLDVGGTQIISSSMELLMDIKEDEVRTIPIKGTAPRLEDHRANKKNLRRLLSSEKERSELLMITDLERNDMNKFCEPGSVKVEEFFIPEEYTTVFHTVSKISGKMREGSTVGKAIRSMFPGGSVTGAPKLSAMKYIDELEGCRRGLYTGSICLLSPKRSVLSICIRTMIHKDGIYKIGTGGGITHESDPQEEYEETIQKSKAMLRALGEER